MLRALLLGLLCALASGSLRADVRAVSQAEIDAAIERGVAHLLDLYQDGEGRDLASPPGTSLTLVDRPGLRALTVYALLKAGVQPEHAVVVKLVERLAFERFTSTYDAACMLLALVALDPVEQRAWIEELAHFLVSSREKAGDFGYPGGGDLSNTQFAAFALRAAVSAGVTVPPAVWTELSEAVLRYQSKDGGFAYVLSARQSSRTMSAAGVGVLAICEVELARSGKLDAESAERLRRVRAEGLEWLARQREYGREDHESWVHYFLYGVERVGSLCALERIGAHDWYREGAAFLVAHQDDHGDWPGTFERVPALFALLFLTRASAGSAATVSARSPRTGPTPRPFPHTRGSDQVGGMRLDVAGSRTVLLSLTRIASPANAAYEWPGERGRGPHVARVEFRADEAPIEVVLADPMRPIEGGRIQCDHRGLARGIHRVTARVFVCPLPGEAKECVLETNGVEVVIDEDVPLARAEPAFDPLLDLVLDAGPRAKASSTRASGPAGFVFAARSAVDGNPRAPWIAEAGDAEPVLEIQLVEPKRARLVRIAPARLTPRSPDFLTLPRSMSVAVNGGAPRVIALTDSSRTWFDVELEKPELVQRLEIRLVGREVPGASVGIGEVVLLEAAVR